jgi:5'-3' exonuclease
MGVPGLFRKVVKDHPESCFWSDDTIVDYFYIDFNAIVYKVINILSIEKVTSQNIAIYEDLLIRRTVEYLKFVIKKIGPKKEVIIGVDGPVPRSKMVKQRFRRYKSIMEYNYKKSLEKKYNIPDKLVKNTWSSASISPGTEFMEKLSNEMKRFISDETKLNPSLHWVYDDYHGPGEGEHKILNHLRTLAENQNKIVIYSPDADLIVLSVMSNRKNILILRDVENSFDSFTYLDIDVCRTGFQSDLTETYGIAENSKDPAENSKEFSLTNRFLMDYSFLTFLCGNDFVTAALFLKVKDNGLDTLLGIYRSNKTDLNDFLIGVDNKVNQNFFKKIIGDLASKEQGLLQKQQRRIHAIKKKEPVSLGSSLDSVGKVTEPETLAKEELQRYQHTEYYSRDHPLFENLNKVFNRIDYYKDSWNLDYNRFFDLRDPTDVSHEYYKSLVYCLQYYVGTNNDWTWFYQYRAPPTFTDLLRYLNSENFSEPKFENNKPFSPLEQLLLILPKKYLYLVPKSLNSAVKTLDVLNDSYPENFILDIVYGTKFIYSEPILPEINSDIVRDLVKNASLTSLEKKRNVVSL